jgi:hypothetical protein
VRIEEVRFPVPGGGWKVPRNVHVDPVRMASRAGTDQSLILHIVNATTQKAQKKPTIEF